VKPYPTPASRYPQALFPKEILNSREFLAEVESGLAQLYDKPVLLLWGVADVGF
jgi:haloalkane dehalogenase